MLLHEAVRAAIRRSCGRPGLVVVGAADGTGATVASTGRAFASRPRCPPADVIFEIGSITKVFTALLLAVAVERGEMGLDDPVREYLPDGTRMPRLGNDITMLHLATHTSGLPRLPPGLTWEALRYRKDPYARLTDRDVLALLSRTRLRLAPGVRMRYSNFGVAVLALALAQVVGTGFEPMVRQRITAPLGMSDTVVTLDGEQRPRLVPGTSAWGKPAGPWTFQGLSGAGALRATAEDLLTFCRAQLGLLPSVSEDLLTAMQATQVERFSSRRLSPAMGLGWILGRAGRNKLPIVWHNGGTGGYRSFVGFAPESRTAAVVLSSTTRSVDAIGLRLLLELAGDRPERQVPLVQPDFRSTSASGR